MTVRGWSRMQGSDFYSDGVFKLVPSLDRCVCVLADCVDGVCETRAVL
jgi:hypothetical protein